MKDLISKLRNIASLYRYIIHRKCKTHIHPPQCQQHTHQSISQLHTHHSLFPFSQSVSRQAAKRSQVILQAASKFPLTKSHHHTSKTTKQLHTILHNHMRFPQLIKDQCNLQDQQIIFQPQIWTFIRLLYRKSMSSLKCQEKCFLNDLKLYFTYFIYLSYFYFFLFK